MRKKIIQPYIFFLLAFALAAILMGSRFFIYINADNAALLYEAKRVHLGEVLNRDFIEINPPLIVYIMLIPVYFHEIFKISLVDGFILFVSSLCVVSLLITFTKIDNKTIKFLLIFLVFLPFSNFFGQREHLYLVLILPYFISLWEKDNPSLFYQIIAGIMAGIGFCIKPYFLPVWLGLIVVKAVLDKRLFSFCNLQNFIIGSFAGLYFLYLIFVEKNYVAIVLPLLLKYYNLFDHKYEVYGIILFDFAVFQLLFWVVFFIKRNTLTRPAYISSFACLISLLALATQNRPFDYYQYPALFFGILTNVLITTALVKNIRVPYNNLILLFTLLAMGNFLGTAFNLDLKSQYSRFENSKNDFAQIIEIYNKYAPNGNVYFFGTAFGKLYFPPLIYSQAETKSYYGMMWLLPTIYSYPSVRVIKEYHPLADKPKDEMQLDRNVLNDLELAPPQIIIVENYDPQIWSFNYIDYFMQYPEFRKIWANYRFLRSLGKQDVYIRVNS